MCVLQWWPGGLGHTATHAVVMAKTISLGQDRGVHPFLVQVEKRYCLRKEEKNSCFFLQLRDPATHQPLPGVIVGEIGPKLGMNSNNQVAIGCQHVTFTFTNMFIFIL